MQDPSFGVTPQLLPHVHLISDFRFPIHHNLTAEMVVEMLIQAPKIVREIQPVSWTYLAQPPADGTVFLAWQPQLQRKLMYASDGYSWADPETQFSQEIKGYMVEILVHRSGWVMGKEMMTSHTRQRYRIVNKQANVQGQFDPQLWLVHYGAADPGHRIPINSLPNNPQIMMQQRERMQLERQGQLARRPFMLHDRQNWPQINLGPGGMGPSYPQQMASQPYMRQPGQIVGQPPAKRLRQNGPGPQPLRDPRMHPGIGEPIWDEEEAVHHGDALDFMTPRDISVLRYQQHHEWMEEIFSSPYAATQLAPVDLGLGLSGELAEITRGILNPPDDAFSLDNTGKLVTEIGKNATYHRVEAEQVEEFDKRVNAYIQKGEDDLQAMRVAHAKTMEKLRQGKTYLKAERQLRESRNASRDAENDVEPDLLDDVVQNVERRLKVTIGPREEVICVSKGGLIEQEPKLQPQPSGDGIGSTNGTPVVPNGNTAGLDQVASGNGSSNNTPGANSTLLQTSQPTSQLQSAAVTPGMGHQDQGEAADFQAGGGSEAQDGLDLIDSMDLDIPNIPEDEDEMDSKAQDDWVMVDNGNGPDSQMAEEAKPAQATPKPENAGTSAAAAATDAEAPSNTAAAPAADTLAATEAAATTAAATTTTLPTTDDTTPGMFDSIDVNTENAGGDDVDDFNDFANLDSAGDALADFGGAEDGTTAEDALDALDFEDGGAELELGDSPAAEPAENNDIITTTTVTDAATTIEPVGDVAAAADVATSTPTTTLAVTAATDAAVGATVDAGAGEVENATGAATAETGAATTNAAPVEAVAVDAAESNKDENSGSV